MPYANPEYLVESEWLERSLTTPNVRVIEVTGVQSPERKNTAKQLCYDKRHIPGAVFLDVASWYGDFSDPDGEFPLTWPKQAQFEEAMGALGVGNDNHVILYASSVDQAL